MSDYKPGRIPKGERFGQVPRFVALDPDLGPGPFRLNAILCTYVGEDGICWPSLQKAAKSLGISERSIRNWLASLLDAGLVVKTFRKNNTNRYLVIRDPGARDWARGQTFKTQTKPRLEYAARTKYAEPERKKPSVPPEEICTPTGVKKTAPKQTRSTDQFTRPVPGEDLEAEQEHQNRIAHQLGGWAEVAKLSVEEQRRLGLLM